MSEAKCPECDLAQHRGDCFDDEIDARLSKSLRAEGERLRAHGGDSITYVERCDSCETFRQRMIAEKARAEKAEARLTRLLALDGIGNLTVDEVQERIDAAEARAEKLAAALRECQIESKRRDYTLPLEDDAVNSCFRIHGIATRALAEIGKEEK